MTPLTRLLAASLLLSASTTSLAGSPASLQLVCAGGDGDKLCVALAEVLGDATGGKPATLVAHHSNAAHSGQLRITFVQETRTSDSLSGHLVWQMSDSEPVTGPTLEISIMDAALSDDTMRRFATQLVHYSDLPL